MAYDVCVVCVVQAPEEKKFKPKKMFKVSLTLIPAPLYIDFVATCTSTLFVSPHVAGATVRSCSVALRLNL